MSTATMEYVSLGRTELLVSRGRARLHGVRGSGARGQPLGLGRAGCGTGFPASRRAGHHLVGHRERLRRRYLGGDRRPRREEVRAARGGRHRYEGGAPDARRPRGFGTVTQGVLGQVDASLARLGTDYIDRYQVHRFDPATPVDETMEALHEAVAAGKIRYIGGSSMWAWQFSKMQHTASQHG